MDISSTFPALYIGRFQPVHNGHVDALKQILESGKHDQIIIGIGSAQYSRMPENPFTAEERMQMWEAVLADMTDIAAHELFVRTKIEIIPVQNVENDNTWVMHVEQTLPQFGTVYTGSDIVRNLFAKDGKHAVKALSFRINTSATKVRRAMLAAESDELQYDDWETMVPATVADLLKQWQAIALMKEINQK